MTIDHITFCRGPIQFYRNGKVVTGYIEVPCGSRHDVIEPSGALQLPYKYQILAERARVATCCYWKSDVDPSKLDPLKPGSVTSELPDIFEFISLDASEFLPFQYQIRIEDINGKTEFGRPVDTHYVGGWKHEKTPSFYIKPRSSVLGTSSMLNFFEVVPILQNTSIPTKCSNAKAKDFHQGTNDAFPCNGAKSKCPFYTGPYFQYISDDSLEPGKPIIGQMVQEIRSLMVDWGVFEDPQAKWEDTFDIPYIWAWDKDDNEPHTVTGGAQGDFSEAGKTTNLRKILWDVESSSATVVGNIPSTPALPLKLGQSSKPPVKKGDPPYFPTIVNELGEAIISPIAITFPSKQFIHYQFNGSFNLFIAGTSRYVSTIYIVNTSLAEFSTNMDAEKVTDTMISQSIQELLYLGACNKPTSGFIAVSTNSRGGWESRAGIELSPDTINKIYVFANMGGIWSYDYVEVLFKYGAVEVLQTSTTSDIRGPSSDALTTRIASLNNIKMKFDVIPIGAAAAITIDKAYHFYIHDKSASRFVQDKTEEELPNQRSWKITTKKLDLVGNGHKNNKADLIWHKLDNCNRYLIEILSLDLSRIIPMGIDRSWEPTEIKFSINEDSEIEMKVSTDFGRSYHGNILPINCIIVEPKNGVDIAGYTKNSEIQVKLETYKINGDGKDDTARLVDLYGDSTIYSIGGVRLAKISSTDIIKDFGHSIKVTSPQSLEVDINNRYDMSYVLEIYMDGVPVGRKWFCGVAELADSWGRDLDITYIWGATQQFLVQKPAYWAGLSGDNSETDIGNLEDEKYTIYRARCKDHDSIMSASGPLFYPYDSCEQPKYLGTATFGQNAIEYTLSYAQPIDEKYRGPNRNEPYLVHHNVLSAIVRCIFEFTWGTFFRTQSEWLGFARVRGPISPFFNIMKWILSVEYGWTLPQFGNCGRDHIRVVKTMHYRQFIYILSGVPRVGEGWLPALPFIGSNSIFDDGTKARNALDQTVEGTAPTFSIDPLSYSDGNALLEMSSDGIDINTGLADMEIFTNERKGFQDVYKLRKVRTANGYGSLWPPEGYYFNFQSTEVAWSYPEKDIVTVFRDWSNVKGDPLIEDKFLTGISISKPILDNINTAVAEKYNRPIHFALPENRYTLKLKDQQYDSIGGILNYAYLEYGDSVLGDVNKLYFDRFTGEIMTSGYYNSDTLQELGDKIPGLPVTVYYTDPTSHNEPTESGSISGTYIKVGNIALIDDKGLRVYAQATLEDVLDTTVDDEWAAFLPSLNIDSIVPRFLPQKEISVESINSIVAKVNYSVYPSKDPTRRQELSNKDLPGMEFLSGSVENVTFAPLSLADDTMEAEDGYDPKTGCIDKSVITLKFNHPVMISTLNIGYQINGEINTYYGPWNNTTPTELEGDPAFEISLEEGGNKTILISKPELTDPSVTTKSSLSREFKFSIAIQENNGNSTQEKIYKMESPIKTTQIKITIGQRRKRVGFELTKFGVSAAVLNEISEEIIVTEAKYYVTGGLSSDGANKFRMSAQDPYKLTSIVSSIDMGDPLEAAGITEYWRPPISAESATPIEVGTFGKLRKHWAGEFSTYDTKKYYEGKEGDIIKDAGPAELEGRQTKMLKDIGTNASKKMGPRFLNQTYNLYISPYDRYTLERLNSKLNNKTSVFNLIDVAKDYPPVKGKLSPGWQEQGYHACIDRSVLYPPTRTCKEFAWAQEAQGACYGNGWTLTLSILDPLFWFNYMKLLGSSDNLTNKALELNQATAAGNDLWKYKFGSDPKRRYRE